MHVSMLKPVKLVKIYKTIAMKVRKPIVKPYKTCKTYKTHNHESKKTYCKTL